MTALRSMAARVPPLGWLLLLAAALWLPRLGAFGFWEPWEARVADPGTAVTSIPPAAGMLLSAGARLGGGEGRARILFALVGLASVAAVYWAGLGLFGRRAAALGAAALVTMPLFSFQARQLISDMPLVLALALSLGGLGRFLWAGRRPVDLAVGVAGLALGWAAGGAMVGVALPCVAAGAAGLLGREGGRVVPVGLAALGVGLLALSLLRTHTAGAYTGLLGGVPRLGGSALTWDWTLRQLGFGLFPWSGLVFFALADPLVAEERATPPRLYLLLFAAFGLVLATVRGHLVGEGRFAALAPLALALGVYLHQQAEREVPERIVALLAAVGTVLVARDLYLGPEELFSVHTLEKVRWPVKLGGQALLLGAGICFAAALWVGIGLRRRIGIAAAVAVAAVFSGLVLQGMVPALSQHLSPRAVIDTYRRAAAGGAPLGRYRVEGQGSSALRSAPGPVLASPQAVAAHLAGPAAAYVVIAAEELAPVDEALKVAGRAYTVLDASSSRLLLLSNRPLAGEPDRNPLRQHVFLATSPDQRPPWPPPRVARSTVFVDSIQLIGADFPTSVQRPSGFKLTLHFKVLRKPPPGYNIFVHLARPGQSLINGDHLPVGGTFPTAHWVAGEYIRDEHTIEMPLAVTPSGTYDLFVGFWPGGNRPGIKITSGETDGHDRSPLGRVVIK